MRRPGVQAKPWPPILGLTNSYPPRGDLCKRVSSGLFPPQLWSTWLQDVFMLTRGHWISCGRLVLRQCMYVYLLEKKSQNAGKGGNRRTTWKSTYSFLRSQWRHPESFVQAEHPRREEEGQWLVEASLWLLRKCWGGWQVARSGCRLIAVTGQCFKRLMVMTFCR